MFVVTEILLFEFLALLAAVVQGGWLVDAWQSAPIGRDESLKLQLMG